MRKFNIKLCSIFVCFLIQGSWAITWQHVVDPPEERGFYNFGWHVYTVTVKEFDHEYKSFTVDTVDGKVSVDGKDPVRADIKDLSCIGKKFERPGDFCKFKARLPDQTIPQNSTGRILKNMTFNVKYFFNNEMLEFYHNKYSIDPNGRKPIYRVADVEEKNDYPALGVPNKDYGVLVLGNGGVESLAITGHHGVLVLGNGGVDSLTITDIRSNRSDRNFSSVDKNLEGGEDPLYGTNIECTKPLVLEKLHDTCILVYRFIPIQTESGLLPLPSKDIVFTINGTSYSQTVKAIVSSPLKLMVGPIKASNSLYAVAPPIQWSGKISYFGQEAIKVSIYAVNEQGELFIVGKEFFSAVPDGMWDTRSFNIYRYSGKRMNLQDGIYHILLFLPDGTTYSPKDSDFEVKSLSL